jgi:hypothetical protein
MDLPFLLGMVAESYYHDSLSLCTHGRHVAMSTIHSLCKASKIKGLVVDPTRSAK